MHMMAYMHDMVMFEWWHYQGNSKELHCVEATANQQMIECQCMGSHANKIDKQSSSWQYTCEVVIDLSMWHKCIVLKCLHMHIKNYSRVLQHQNM